MDRSKPAFHPELRKVLLFLAVGGLSTVFNYAVFLLCLRVFHLHYIISNVTGYVSGLLLGYYLNARYTFESRARLEGSQPVLYATVYLVSLGISMALLYLMVSVLKMRPEIANLAAIGQSTVTNYLGCRFAVFGKQKDKR